MATTLSAKRLNPAVAFIQRRPVLAWVIAFVALAGGGLLTGSLLASLVGQIGWELQAQGQIQALYQDWQGNVWASRQQPDALTVYAVQGQETTIDVSGVTGNEGYVFAVDHDGRLWIGGGDGTVSRLDPGGGWAHYAADLPFGPWPIQSIVVDWQDRAWVHVGGEVGIIDPRAEATAYSVGEFGLADTHVAELMGDRQGQVWIVQQNVLKVLGPEQTWKDLGEASSACIESRGWGQRQICDRAALDIQIPKAPDGSDGKFGFTDDNGLHWFVSSSGLWTYDSSTSATGEASAVSGLLLGLGGGLIVGLAGGLLALIRSRRSMWPLPGQLLPAFVAWYVVNGAFYHAANAAVYPRFYDIGVIGAVVLFGFAAMGGLAINIVAGILLLVLKRDWLLAGCVLAYIVNLLVIFGQGQHDPGELLTFGAGTIPFFLLGL